MLDGHENTLDDSVSRTFVKRTQPKRLLAVSAVTEALLPSHLQPTTSIALTGKDATQQLAPQA